MSLYRKYRPQFFSDVVGQEVSLKILRGSIEKEMIGHAYVFSGPRGTGKTSLARIFAKAINCVGEGEKPCGKCHVCEQVSTGSFLDLIEIDAASNRGIDQIRDLRDKIQLMPSSGKYKVYIIDEAHMLTKDAFNALLKTLEEPPSHVVFILATTETHKIPLTILSRCQRLGFTRIDPEPLFLALKNICSSEGISTDDQSLRRLISLGEGSFRDTLSLLDQVRAFMGGEDISEEKIENVLGLSSRDQIYKFIEGVVDNNQSLIVSIVEDLYRHGVDFENFLKELIIEFYSLVVNKNSKTDGLYKKISDLSPDRKSKILNTLTSGVNKVRNVLVPNVSLSVVAFDAMDVGGADMKNTSIPDKVVVKNTPEANKESDKVITQNLKDVEAPFSANNPTSPSVSAVDDSWPLVMSKVRKERMSIGIAIQEADHNLAGGEMIIGVSNKFLERQLNEVKNLDYISGVIREFYGNDINIKVICKESESIENNNSIEQEVLDVFEDGEILD